MNPDAAIFVAGHRGLVGSALVRRIEPEPIGELITATSEELDLRLQEPTRAFVAARRPEVVLLAAARAGGINANRLAQADFLYDNLMIAANVIEACHRTGVEKLVVLGSSCIYPREAPQPMREEALLTGPLEPTNEGYAVAKIAALELAKMFRRQHGMNVSDAARHEAKTVVFESYTELGFNYRLTDLQAAVGREQLRRLPGSNLHCGLSIPTCGS